MIRLFTLGSIDLRDATGTPVEAVLHQPKRVAILLYLALGAGGRPVRRDSLLALFWPEASEDRARNSLRQAVHQLRRALGDETFLTRGTEEVGPDPVGLWCDALAFAAALEAGRLEDALALYRGDLAPGLHVADCPALGEWLEAERARLRRAAVGAAGLLAERAAAAGDLGHAVGWARRAVALSPLEEEPARRLITLLDAAGDRGGALAEFEQLAGRLRRELDVGPSAETRRLIAELRARPEPAPRHTPLSVPILARAEPPPAVPPSGGATGRRWRGAVALLLVLALALGAVWPFLAPIRGGMALDPRAVVVVPFRVSGAEPSLAYLREGMLDLLGTKLQSPGPLVAADPRAVLGTWRQLSGGTGVDLTPEDGAQVARRLGAGRLLLGSVVGTEGRLTISARLLDVRTGAVRAAGGVLGPMDSLPALVDDLVAQLLVGETGEGRGELAELTTASLPALRAWLAGREAYRHGAYDSALVHFAKATELDSTFAVAWLWRLDASDWVGDRQLYRVRPRALAQRERLSPRDQAYLRALAGTDSSRYPPPSVRLAAWEDVVRMSPDRPEGWFGLGDVLFHYGASLGADSGFVRAEAAFQRAHGLDSTYVAPLTHLVQAALIRGDTATARRRAELLRAADPNGVRTGVMGWWLAMALGDSVDQVSARLRLARSSSSTLVQVTTWSMLVGVGGDDGLLAARTNLANASTDEERRYALSLLAQASLAAGRLAEYHATLDRVGAIGQEPRWAYWPVNAALFHDGDSVVAESVLAIGRAHAHDRRYAASLYLEDFWRAWWGGRSDSSRFYRELATAVRLTPALAAERGQLEVLFDALLHCQRADPAADRVVARLRALKDSLQGDVFPYVRVGLARCYGELGQPALALRELQGRPLDLWRGLPGIAPSLRMEGDFALAVGDTAAARRAWRHYLSLRSGADSPVQRWVLEVRRKLAAIGG
jgi:DNA-binding SARP family transcriptional activator/TolB-like protein